MWFYNSVDVYPKTNPISKRSSYDIRNANVTNTGYYFCYGKYETSQEYFVAKAHITINGNTYERVDMLNCLMF